MRRESGDILSRRDLLSFVRAHPGCHLREVERGTGLAVGVLRHHLDYLVRVALVKEEDDGRLRRFFPMGLDTGLRRAIAGLRARSHRAVLLHLLNHEGATHKDIAVALGLPPSSTSHYLGALVSAGLVERDPVTRGHRLVDADGVVRALVAYRPSFADRLVDAALELWFESP